MGKKICIKITSETRKACWSDDQRRKRRDSWDSVKRNQYRPILANINHMLVKEARIARDLGRTADYHQASEAVVQGTSSFLTVGQDHRRSKNQLLRFPVASCDCTPATFAFAGPSPPPRSGFAMREPPKLKLAFPSMLGKPRVEPCFAASRRSLTAVSWASNLSA